MKGRCYILARDPSAGIRNNSTWHPDLQQVLEPNLFAVERWSMKHSLEEGVAVRMSEACNTPAIG